jgi:hypothetical protein
MNKKLVFVERNGYSDVNANMTGLDLDTYSSMIPGVSVFGCGVSRDQFLI